MSGNEPTQIALDRVGKRAQQWWSAVFVLHRLDHAATYVPTFVWGVFVSAPGVASLGSVWILVGISINVLTVFGGFVLNTVTDIRSDLRNENKLYMVEALRVVGVKWSLRIYLWEQVAALILAAVAAIALDRLIILAITALAIFVNWAYSSLPFRMKGRSLGGPIFMGLKSGLAPGLVAMSTVPGGEYTYATAALLVGLTFCTASRGIWHSIPDLYADQSSGVETIAVRHGVTWAVRGSMLAIVTGCGLNFVACIFLLGWWGVVACVGMVGTIYHRYRVGSLENESAIIEHMNDTQSEITNARWNRATYSTLCLAALGYLAFSG